MTGNAWVTLVVWGGAAALGAIALIAWYFALLHDPARGRRRCPRCWYDLSGTLSSRTCPECGYTARAERALRRSRKRWRLAALGLVLALAALVLPRYATTDLQQAKPVWWLAIEMRFDGDRGEYARTELIRRGRDGRLSVAQQRRIADRVLAVQANPDAEWNPGPAGRPFLRGDSWANLFEDAWQRGALTDEQFDRYLRNAFEYGLQTENRPRVTAGEPIPVRISTSRRRLSLNWGRRLPRPYVSLMMILRSIEGADSLSREEMDELRTLGMTQVLEWEHSLWLPGIDAPGVHEVKVEMDLAVVPQFEDPYPTVRSTPRKDFADAMSRWQRTETLTVEVLPRDTPSVVMLAEPGFKPALHNAIQIEFEPYMAVALRERIYRAPPPMIVVHPIPINVAFDVILVGESAEVMIGSFVARGGVADPQIIRRFDHSPWEMFPTDDCVTVILRSSRRAAEATLDMTTIWEGEIQFDEVRIWPSEID